MLSRSKRSFVLRRRNLLQICYTRRRKLWVWGGAITPRRICDSQQVLQSGSFPVTGGYTAKQWVWGVHCSTPDGEEWVVSLDHHRLRRTVEQCASIHARCTSTKVMWGLQHHSEQSRAHSDSHSSTRCVKLLRLSCGKCNDGRLRSLQSVRSGQNEGALHMWASTYR